MKQRIKSIFSFFVMIVLFYSCQKKIECPDCGTNKPPLASAGSDQKITLPKDSVVLDGSASSDPDGAIISYKWTKVAGPATFIINNETARSTVVKGLAGGIYQFELKVTDDGGLSARDTVQVIVDAPGNQPPVAYAGADTTITLPNSMANLDGSRSIDPDNNITSYTWAKISGPSSFNFENANAVRTQVSTLIQGIYQFELKVTDAGGLSSKDTVQVMVDNPGNQPPKACAGADQTITLPVNTVTLDGSCSSDPDNNITSYAWSKFFGPPNFSITNSAVAQTQVTNLVEGTYFFELRITDAGGLTSKDTIHVVVYPAIIACDNSNRPVINTRLVEIGTISKPRIQMATAAAGTKILFAGGRWSADCPDCWGSSRVDIYDTVTKRWSIAELSQGRFGMGAVTAGNKIFFAGGQAGDGARDALYSTVDIYDASTNTWSVAALSEARGYVSAATVGDKVFFAGGGDGDDLRNPYTNKVDIYNLSSNTWSTASLSDPRPGISAVTVNQKIYFAGALVPTKSIDIYDNATGSWSTSSLKFPMGSLAGIAHAGKIYWAADCNVEIKNVNTWSSTNANLFEPGAWIINDGQNAVIKDNKIIFFRNINVTGKFDIYDLSTNTWSIGVLPHDKFEYGSIISVNNIIYVTNGVQVWKLEF